ncbi:MAG: hypothetical protein VCA36_05195, partial [Opitutales bacterium]
MSKTRRKSARRSRGTRGIPRNGSVRDNGDTPFWQNRAIIVRLISAALFIVAVVVTCFLGQSPPSLKMLPRMIARESVYSDRSFEYNSTVRTERRREEAAQSTPRVFARDMDAEELFTKGVEDLRLKLEHRLNSDNAGEDLSTRLLQQLKDSFSIQVDAHDFDVFSLIKDEEDRNRMFNELATAVREINEIGILEERTEDQRFLSFEEAETELESQCSEITRQLRLVGGLDVSQDLLLALDLEAFEEEYPALRTVLSENNFTNPAEPFPERGVTIGDLVDSKEVEVAAEATIF